MDEIRVPIYLMTGFLESWEDVIFKFYDWAGLLLYRWADTFDPL